MRSTCEELAPRGSGAVLGVLPTPGPPEWALPLCIPADCLAPWFLKALSVLLWNILSLEKTRQNFLKQNTTH